MDKGWIKLHRKMINWEWIGDYKVLALFIHLLLKANHEDKQWKGITIRRGQLVTGRNKLSKDTGLSVQNIRTALAKLKSTNEVTIKSTSAYSILTLNKYNDYQQTNHQTNKRLTTTKERKEIKNTIMCNSDFDKFWEVYKNKTNKKKSMEKFLTLDRKLLSKILNAIQDQKQGRQWKEGFIPHPTTWINGERWNDEVEVVRQVSTKSRDQVAQDQFLKNIGVNL